MNWTIRKLNDQCHEGFDKGVTLRYGPKDYRAKDEADARDRVLPIVEFANSQRQRPWQIEQSASGGFYVSGNGKTELCNTLADVRKAVANIAKPADKPAPKRHDHIPQTHGPLRTRLLAENAAIDAAEKEQAEREQQSQFTKQIAKELFDLQTQGSELAAQEKQLQIDLHRQQIIDRIRQVRETSSDPTELGKLRESLYVSFATHGNPTPTDSTTDTVDTSEEGGQN